MKKDEELNLKLRDVLKNFKDEEYERSLLSLDAAGKLIIAALNIYNRKK
jgi:hypothetical protein